MGETENGTSWYILQNVHALWLHPVVTCKSSDRSSYGGLYVSPE